MIRVDRLSAKRLTGSVRRRRPELDVVDDLLDLDGLMVLVMIPPVRDTLRLVGDGLVRCDDGGRNDAILGVLGEGHRRHQRCLGGPDHLDDCLRAADRDRPDR